MKIVILGAGHVGTSMAEILSLEANDVTLIDRNANQLEGLQDQLDIRTIVGNGPHPGILEQASVELQAILGKTCPVDLALRQRRFQRAQPLAIDRDVLGVVTVVGLERHYRVPHARGAPQR